MKRSLFVLLPLALAACASQETVRPVEPFDQPGALPQQLTSPSAGAQSDYRIGATDVLAVQVFQVQDLTFERISVDASGRLQMPLIGSVPAAGLTPAELSAELGRRLSERYLRNPQVTVTVVEAASQKVTVDGAVTKPGVYEMRGRTTLLQAIAMAEGPTRIAQLEKVAVFRMVDGQRMAAIFDLRQIRQGRMPDPYLQGDDVVIVDTSRLGAAWQNALQVLPGLGVFGVFR